MQTEKERHNRLITRGTLLRGRFRIEEVLGERDIGVTYLVKDNQSGKRCIVKHLSLLEAKSRDDFSNLEREARIIKNLDHAGIPGFVDYFDESTETDRSAYLVQEFIEGKNLKELLEGGRHFTEKQAIKIIFELIKVLEYLHSFSPPIIHRDIKPSNVLLASDSRVYLTGFAGVRENFMSEKMSDSASTAIYGYIPPEQYVGRAVTASDIYSLGVTLIVLLSHLEPMDMESEDKRLEFRPYVNISVQFASVIDRMIEPDIDKRYRSIQELKKDIGDLLVPGKTRKSVNIWAIAVVVFGLSLAVSFHLLKLSNPRELPTQNVPEKNPLPIPIPSQTTPPTQKPSSVIGGRLFYDELPITKFTTKSATFWFRNESAGTEQAAQVIYKEGAFEIFGLPPGRYGVDVQIRTGAGGYTGNFNAWKTFSIVDEEVRQELDIDLHKIIHMTSPQDNRRGLARWDADCEGKISFFSPVIFAWESLSEGVEYGYTIDRYQCEPFQRIDSAIDGYTEETQLKADLLSSKGNEIYILRLSARKGDLLLGSLETYGINGGRAWDYRFRVD